jgi:hypothetical protein
VKDVTLPSAADKIYYKVCEGNNQLLDSTQSPIYPILEMDKKM